MEDEEHAGVGNKEKFDQLIINMFSMLFAFIKSMIHGEMVKNSLGETNNFMGSNLCQSPMDRDFIS